MFDEIIEWVKIIIVFAVTIAVATYVVSPVLNWLDTVPLDGAIPLATAWDGWFWITLVITGLVLWALKAFVVDEISG